MGFRPWLVCREQRSRTDTTTQLYYKTMSGLEKRYPRGRTLGLLKVSLYRKEETIVEVDMEEADEEVKKVESEKRSRDNEFDDKENEPSDKKNKERY